MKSIIVSGHFRIPHLGHLNYLRAAADFGDELWVIVNSDKQIALRGSTKCLNEQTRLELVKELKCVNHVVLAMDDDLSVSKTIRQILEHNSRGQTWYFVNGGDRRSDNLNYDEIKVCRELGIIVLTGMGGYEKIDSSTNIVNSIYKQEQKRRGL